MQIHLDLHKIIQICRSNFPQRLSPIMTYGVAGEVYTHGSALSFFFKMGLDSDHRENREKRQKEGFLFSLETNIIMPNKTKRT